MPPKILHIINGLSTGGAETTLYNLLASGLAEKFTHKVFSLTNKGTLGPSIQDLGIPVISLNTHSRTYSIINLIKLKKILQKSRPNIIQGWMYYGNIAATYAKYLSPPKTLLIWNIRHSLYPSIEKKISTRLSIYANKILSNNTNSIIYNSYTSKNQHELFGINKKYSNVIPNGFDSFRFYPDKQTNYKIRNKLKIPYKSIVIGNIGRFNPLKNHALFLQASQYIYKHNKNIHFLMAGKNINRNNKKLKHLISTIPESNIHMIDEHSHIEKIMQSINILCQTSHSEAFPNVLGEAMACGIPCIATDVGDSSRIIGKAGLVIPPNDIHSLTKGLKDLISITDEKREALGKKARKHIVQNYSLESAVQQYSTLYKSLLKDLPECAE